MRTPRIEILIDDLCTEIDRLEYKLDKATEEANYWREAFHKATSSAIQHNEQMMSTMLTTLLTPGVTDALVKENQP